MQAVGDLSSTKLSAYLALGCISPRAIWHEVERVRRAAEAAGLPQEAACSWLGMHLQIRCVQGWKQGNADTHSYAPQ